MSQRLIIDLKKNPKVADLVADLEPGQKIDATLNIVAKDDQTLTADLGYVCEHDESAMEEEDPAKDEKSADDEGSEDTPAMRVARGEVA